MTAWADSMACNLHCECWPIEAGRVARALPEAVGALLDDRHAHLFAETGVFLSSSDLTAMTDQVIAIETAARQPAYVERVLSAADDSMESEPQASTRGLLMGYDFHLSGEGPRLIEINTNAGGAFLVQHMVETLGVTHSFARASSVASDADLGAKLAEMFVSEWRLAGRSGSPSTIVIVDEAPESEYLYSDMQLAAVLLRRRFDRVIVAGVDELGFRQGRLWVRPALSEVSAVMEEVDLVYNRLTDFTLTSSGSQALREAWVANAAVVSPSPRHHALLANKLNLQVLGDAEFISALDLAPKHESSLAQIPATVQVTPANAERLWRARKQLFFKPAAGYAGRMAYRGAKLTRKRWQILLNDLQPYPYVAQTLVNPGKRLITDGAGGAATQRLKFDVRIYSYAAQPLLLAARVYDGQTTNFRTPGGGFAPVAILQDQPGLLTGQVHCARELDV